MAINLLYPNGVGAEERKESITQLIRAFDLDKKFGRKCAGFFTSNKEAIRYRLSLFEDIIENPQILEMLSDCAENLHNVRPVVHDRDLKGLFNVGLLASLRDARLHVYITDSIYNTLSACESNLKSSALIDLLDLTRKEAGSADYQKMKKGLEELSGDVAKLKSVTVGINISPQFVPYEAGIVSLNTESYKYGNFIDKLLRLDFKENGYDCIAPLTKLNTSDDESRIGQFNDAILSSMERVLRPQLIGSGKEFSAFVSKHTVSLSFIVDQLTFICDVCKYLRELQAADIRLCFPEIADDGETHLSGVLPLQLYPVKEVEDLVKNGVNFDDEGRIYILTGPNSGGKSVYLRTVALCYLLTGLGVPIPADYGRITPVENIVMFFPTERGSAHGGRLEEECREISELYDVITKNTLVLMDETFSSTSATDGAVLAASTINRLSDIGCTCIFSTHIHELSAKKDQLNMTGQSRVDLLAAQVENGRRTYKIARGQSETGSDARTIAKKYGII